MKSSFTKTAVIFSVFLSPAAWADSPSQPGATPQPATQLSRSQTLQTPPPGAWTSDTFKGVTDEIRLDSANLESGDRAKARQNMVATTPLINPAGITVLAFFAALPPADDAGLCKIAAAARTYPALVTASYYLVVQPDQQQGAKPPPVQGARTCLAGVRAKMDLRGALYSSLEPEGLPAALFMYRGLKQWVRLQDAGLALNELFLAAGVKVPSGSPTQSGVSGGLDPFR